MTEKSVFGVTFSFKVFRPGKVQIVFYSLTKQIKTFYAVRIQNNNNNNGKALIKLYKRLDFSFFIRLHFSFTTSKTYTVILLSKFPR